MSILILASPTDTTAIRVAYMLRQRLGATRVTVRTPEEIALAPVWHHEVSTSMTSTFIRLHDGGTVERPRLIFNRVQQVESFPLGRSSQEAREFGQTEVSALLLSWLHGEGCPVINRPSPSGLVGHCMRPLLWQRLAVRVGLPVLIGGATSSTRRYPTQHPFTTHDHNGFAYLPRVNGFGYYSETSSSERSVVYVIGKRAMGNAPPQVANACVRLAAMVGLELLQVEFVRTSSAAQLPSFAGASPFVFSDDTSVIHSICDYLENRANSCPQEGYS